jgi:hypothetical protein
MKTKAERKRDVATMKANFALEGGVPDASQEALLSQYIEGTASFQDLFDHAREFVLTHQEREQLEADKERLARNHARLEEEYMKSGKEYDAERKQRARERESMTSEQRKRHEAIDAARANVELSGLKISGKMWRDSLRFARCEITLEEYISLYIKNPCK